MLSPEMSFAELPHPVKHSSVITPTHTECLMCRALILFIVITVPDDKPNRRPEASSRRPAKHMPHPSP